MSEDTQTSVILRDVVDSDVAIFFEMQRDSDASYMAGFASGDLDNREAYVEHWAKNRADSRRILRTIVVDGQVAGNVVSYLWEGKRSVSYWLDKAYWGKGIATEALKQFLQIDTERPLQAMVVLDNLGSRRVLTKCGFVEAVRGRAFSSIRGEEIDEIYMVLE